MSDVKWIKIVTDMFEDEKIVLIEAMPEADSIIVIWVKILCMAGKQNNGGVLMLNDRMPYSDEMLATIFRRSLPIIRLALGVLEQLGMIEIISGAVTISNWGKHQNFEGIQARRDYMAGYMRDYREKQKLIAESTDSKRLHKLNVSAPEGELDIEEDKKEKKKKNTREIPIAENPRKSDDQFDSFWKAYPRKEGKSEARKKFEAIMKSKDAPTIEKLIASIEDHKRSYGWQKDNGQFIPQPARYLNAGMYDDEITEVFGSSNSTGVSADYFKQKAEEYKKNGK